MKTAKKAIVLVMCAALLVVGTVAGTMAYLTDKTATVTNTFTVGNIGITLTESNNLDLKMVPGKDLAKDPKVTVTSGSELCWVFVKIDTINDFETFMEYKVNTTVDNNITTPYNVWTKGDGTSIPENVYYRIADATSADVSYYILEGKNDVESLKNGYVLVKPTTTKGQMDAVGVNKPAMSFTAYAVQKFGFDSASAAWEQVKNL